jgi:iron(III) transport system substrate-binding protein
MVFSRAHWRFRFIMTVDMMEMIVRLTFFLRTYALATCAALTTSYTHAQDAAALNLACSAGPEWCTVFANAFTKTTGVRVNLSVKSTGEVLAQLNAEKANPKLDVWFGGTGDPHLQAAEQDLALEYRSPQLGKLHDWAQAQAKTANYKTVGVYLGVLTFSYNTEIVAKKKIAVPACWKDLLKPEYKKEIQMANPHSSGTAYTAIATIVQLMGEDAAFTYFKQLHPNISQYTRSGSAPVRNAARGENTIGVSFLADIIGEAHSGFPVGGKVPCEGTGYEVGSMTIVKGARNVELAKRFYEWALSPAAQVTAYEAKSYQLPSNTETPPHPLLPNVAEIKLINYDFQKFGTSAMRKRLLDRWDKEVMSTPQ